MMPGLFGNPASFETEGTESFLPERGRELWALVAEISDGQFSAPIRDMSLAKRLRRETHMWRMSLIVAHMRRI